METPEIIYLIPQDLDRDEYVWCDDPAPGLDMEEEDAVKYIRADLVEKPPSNGKCNGQQEVDNSFHCPRCHFHHRTLESALSCCR